MRGLRSTPSGIRMQVNLPNFMITTAERLKKQIIQQAAKGSIACTGVGRYSMRFSYRGGPHGFASVDDRRSPVQLPLMAAQTELAHQPVVGLLTMVKYMLPS